MFTYKPSDGLLRSVRVSATTSARELFNLVQTLATMMKPLDQEDEEIKKIENASAHQPTNGGEVIKLSMLLCVIMQYMLRFNMRYAKWILVV